MQVGNKVGLVRGWGKVVTWTGRMAECRYIRVVVWVVLLWKVIPMHVLHEEFYSQVLGGGRHDYAVEVRGEGGYGHRRV